MRLTDARTKAAWLGEVKAGDTRPVVRATMARMFMGPHPYNTEDAPGGDADHARTRTGFYRSWVFGHGGAPREVPNLRKCDWNRNVDQDIATCTLTVQNTQLIPIGSTEGSDDEFEQPGYLTFSRGDAGEYAAATNRYGYQPNPYYNFIRPDRIVRTYEGYGADYTVAPGDDPHLYISGTWLIDDVTYNANGDITIEMRDMGRLLLDHISFPPIVPYADYPQEWIRIGTIPSKGRGPTGGTYKQPVASNVSSSNERYVGRNIKDTPTYVSNSGVVMGHGMRAPLSGQTGDYWLSTGQPDPKSVVYWQQAFSQKQNMAAVRLKMLGGPYKVYVSVRNADGDWIGRKTIPYKVGYVGGSEATDTGDGGVSSVDIAADIPFVAEAAIPDGKPYVVTFPRRYRNITAVRITITGLREMAGITYPFRAGIRSVECYTGPFDDLGFDTNTTVNKLVGNYNDFTDIIRWVTAWCGFWWPDESDLSWQRFRDSLADADKTHYAYPGNDGVLVRGRIWGTLEQTGTGGAYKGQETFDTTGLDKQPMMTVIQKIREIVPFSFWVDETGGIVWRRANIDTGGNYITRDHKQTRKSPLRTDDYVTVTDRDVLLGYQAKLSSKNIRERIFIGSGNGKVGSVVRGYEPLAKTGMRRVAGWLDQNWATKREATVMGELTAQRQMFDYRRSSWTIWGNPAIQIDDQVHLVERVSNEDFFHYVLGISSSLDMEAGTWSYEVDSHWLGNDPGNFVAGRKFMSTVTQNYLDAVGGEK